MLFVKREITSRKNTYNYSADKGIGKFFICIIAMLQAAKKVDKSDYLFKNILKLKNKQQS